MDATRHRTFIESRSGSPDLKPADPKPLFPLVPTGNMRDHRRQLVRIFNLTKSNAPKPMSSDGHKSLWHRLGSKSPSPCLGTNSNVHAKSKRGCRNGGTSWTSLVRTSLTIPEAFFGMRRSGFLNTPPLVTLHTFHFSAFPRPARSEIRNQLQAAPPFNSCIVSWLETSATKHGSLPGSRANANS